MRLVLLDPPVSLEVDNPWTWYSRRIRRYPIEFSVWFTGLGVEAGRDCRVDSAATFSRTNNIHMGHQASSNTEEGGRGKKKLSSFLIKILEYSQ